MQMLGIYLDCHACVLHEKLDYESLLIGLIIHSVCFHQCVYIHDIKGKCIISGTAGYRVVSFFLEVLLLSIATHFWPNFYLFIYRVDFVVMWLLPSRLLISSHTEP